MADSYATRACTASVKTMEWCPGYRLTLNMSCPRASHWLPQVVEGDS